MPDVGQIELTAVSFDAGRTTVECARPTALSAPAPTPDEVEAQHWVAQAAAGNREAFDAIVEVFQDRLYRFLLRMTRNTEDAEDLAQDTFIKAFLALRRGIVPNLLSPWLFTIARRTALNHLRGRHPLEPLDEAAAEVSTDCPASDVSVRDDGEQLWRLARRLPAQHYEILWLRYSEGFSIAEVARITRSTQIGVKVILHRARKKLASWINQENRATRPPLPSRP